MLIFFLGLQNQFLKRLLILFIHLFFLSISVYLRPITENLANKAEREESGIGDDNENNDDMDATQVIRYGSECATLLCVLSYVIVQQGDEIRNQGFSAFIKQLVCSLRKQYIVFIYIFDFLFQFHDPAKAIFLISNILILACIPFRMIGDTNTEEAILGFAVPGSWFLLMFFAGAVRLTGPFVTMIYSMITGDMFTFGIIYLIVLFGFSQAFYFLYKG